MANTTGSPDTRARWQLAPKDDITPMEVLRLVQLLMSDREGASPEWLIKVAREWDLERHLAPA